MPAATRPPSRSGPRYGDVAAGAFRTGRLPAAHPPRRPNEYDRRLGATRPPGTTLGRALMTVHTGTDHAATERLRAQIAEVLTRARARTTVLTEAVDEAELVAQHSPLMSPLVWDLAHIGNQEELWLVRDVGGREPVRADIDHLYDAFRHARADRPALPLLNPAQARGYVGTVRDKVLDVLNS